MNEQKENEKLIHFWNNAFEKVQPMKLDSSMFDVKIPFHQCLKTLGDHCESVLDLGSGWGYGSFATKLLGAKVKEIIALDPSVHAIKTIEATNKLSDIKGIKTMLGTHEALSQFEDEIFEGIICSNTLDVLPKTTSQAVIKTIKRLLKPGGYLLLKFNFFLTDDLIEKIGMKAMDENTYAIDGILRGYNLQTSAWLKFFESYEVLEETTFERIPNGPKDRVLLLKKANKNTQV